MFRSDKPSNEDYGGSLVAGPTVNKENLMAPEQKATPSAILNIPLPKLEASYLNNHEDISMQGEGEGSISSAAQRTDHSGRHNHPHLHHHHHHHHDGLQHKVSSTEASTGLDDVLLSTEPERPSKTFMEQLINWVHNERNRRHAIKVKLDAKNEKRENERRQEQENSSREDGSSLAMERKKENIIPSLGGEGIASSERCRSDVSSTSSANIFAALDKSLEQLEHIIAENLGPGMSLDSFARSHHTQLQKRPSMSRKSSSGKIKPPRTPRTASDTDICSDSGDVIVPTCEVHLGIPEKIGMDNFKNEVLKLAHTLGCKGWRRIDLQNYKFIDIQRISGALTNAVYMVSPPSDLPLAPRRAAIDSSNASVSSTTTLTRRPQKLLLRIYGPQVAHLIDREVELSILRRLARKKIGPRLLGTFENGRFEQFFHAKTLTRDDIRIPEISGQIAKRMRELHDGMELEEEERRRGPVVWLNWDKWIRRTRQVMEIMDAEAEKEGKGDYLCGLPWPEFEKAVEKYRTWQVEKHGGIEEVKRRLVFAHNDTQYGNILRVIPSGDSPLLLPSNKHKQLVVIDFEYASANVPGFEFANHFCEWMANYHDPKKPYAMRESQYPTLEQQKLFLQAYVEHVEHRLYTTPHPLVGTNSNTANSSTASITGPVGTRQQTQQQLQAFSLDSRTPTSEYKREEAARQAQIDKDVQKLLEETNVWRAASSAVWCAWGVVQARLDTQDPPAKNCAHSSQADGAMEKSTEKEGEGGATADEFNYLGYAQQRALLFLGDLLELGVLKEEELGEKVLRKVKRIRLYG